MPNIHKQTLRAALISIISFGLSFFIFRSGMLSHFEYKAYDLFSRYYAKDSDRDDIIIVKVDQQSIDSLSSEGITWPWPRQIYAPVIEQLSEADAVFIDLLFTEPSSYGMNDDMLLSEAIRKASNVYLPVFLTNSRADIPPGDLEFIKKNSVLSNIHTERIFTSALPPLEVIRKEAKGTGNVTIAPDGDGVYRRVPLFFGMQGLTVPHFVVGYLLKTGLIRITDNLPYSGDVPIPLRDGMLNLHFTKRPFASISVVDIIKSYIDDGKSKPSFYGRDFFRGKKVFLGLTAAGLYDLKPTSVSSISSGVEIHAATLENILGLDFIKTAKDEYIALLSLGICVFIGFFVIRYHSLPLTLGIFGACLFISIFVPALLFSRGYYMPVLQPLISSIFCFTFSAAYSYASEGRQRRFIKRTFLQYMDRQLAEHLLKHPELIRPGGQRQRVTVFFADIAGFTSIAEKTTPEDIARLLHSVLNAFTEVIIDNGGVIDKYIGDCVMAFWGAPVASGEDEKNACRAALQCIESLQRINEDLSAAGLPPVSVRIGIHSGDAVVGNLGSDRIFDYTVVGDTVNTASRLESLNKVFKTKIIISEETREKTSGVFLTRELAMVEVKGKSMPVRIFELICLGDHGGSGEEDLIRIFADGLEALRQQRWQDASAAFDSVLEKSPDDGPALFYREKCQSMMQRPSLTEGIDIIRMKDK